MKIATGRVVTKASADFGGGLIWDPMQMSWGDALFGPIVNSGDVEMMGSFAEMRIAWTDLGDPALVDVHLGMMREQAFNEASWAAVPEGSYVDGYDPDFTQYFEFDPLASTLPNDYPVN